MTKDNIIEQIMEVQQKVVALKKQLNATEISLKNETSRLKSLNKALKSSREIPKVTNYSKELRLVFKAKTYNIGLYVLNVDEKTLSIHGKKQHVTNREAQLLAVFGANLNKLISRTYLLETIWSDTSFRAGRSMDVYICKLRKLLQDDNRLNIINFHGKGYKLLEM